MFDQITKYSHAFQNLCHANKSSSNFLQQTQLQMRNDGLNNLYSIIPRSDGELEREEKTFTPKVLDYLKVPQNWA